MIDDKKFTKYTVFKKTTDDWYPSFYLDDNKTMFVKVSLLKTGPSDIKSEPDEYRVCVWGDDDDGREFDTTDKNKAMELFLTVISKEFVNKDDLKKLKFTIA